MKSSSGTEAKLGGFDAAINRREEDYLNRWPFAQELYGIATTGPDGLVGPHRYLREWATGKSSVLEFIGAMAERDGHTLIRFNPWQYSTKNALWRGFVSAVYNQPMFASMERAGWVRIKKKSRWVLERGKNLEEGAKIFDENAGAIPPGPASYRRPRAPEMTAFFPSTIALEIQETTYE